MAAIIVQQTFEKELAPRSLLTEGHGCIRQLGLHLLEEIAIEDRRMLPRMTLTSFTLRFVTIVSAAYVPFEIRLLQWR